MNMTLSKKKSNKCLHSYLSILHFDIVRHEVIPPTELVITMQGETANKRSGTMKYKISMYMLPSSFLSCVLSCPISSHLLYLI